MEQHADQLDNLRDGDELRKRPRDELLSPDQQQQQQQQSDELLGPQNQNQPLACVACAASAVKYRCPRCERVTCSLACCLEHKRTFECDGKRDRTQFVALKQFTDANLSSDFFFLEEVARSTNSAARSRAQIGADARQFGAKKRKVAAASKGKQSVAKAINPHVSSDWLARFPVPFQILVQHAAKRGVALTLLAPGMSKRVRNTSHMDARKDKLFWRVEWTFPSADTPVNLAETKADDAQTPFALLAQYLAKSPENATIRGKLRKYAVADWQERVLLLLRKEFTPASQPQYYRLDGNLSLESNLKRKAVVEFPVIIVALREDADTYPVAHDRIEVVSVDENGDKDESSEEQSETDDDDMSGGGEDSQIGAEPPAGDAGEGTLDADADAGAAESALGSNSYDEFLVDDEHSLDDLLPSIAEADDELRMFGEHVDGVDFLFKPSSAAAADAPLIEEEPVGLQELH